MKTRLLTTYHLMIRAEQKFVLLILSVSERIKVIACDRAKSVPNITFDMEYGWEKFTSSEFEEQTT
jgi:hypothetical protein